MRKGVEVIWFTVLFGGILVLLWYNEGEYKLPTPLSEVYKTIHVGEIIFVAGNAKSTDSKPVFLYFFNPRCPFSKFNIPHFKSLVTRYLISNYAQIALKGLLHEKYHMNINQLALQAYGFQFPNCIIKCKI